MSSPFGQDGLSAAERSRAQFDWYVQTRRKAQLEELMASAGAAVRKIDSWVVGTILAERADNKLATWTGAPAPNEEPVHEVMINLTSGRAMARGGAVPKAERARAIDVRRAEADIALRGIRTEFERRGIEIQEEFWLTHSVLATLTSSEVLAIAARDDVGSIMSNKLRHTETLDVSRPRIRADVVVPAGTTGAGISVAIVDTGVDGAHPALAGVVGPQQDVTGTAVNRDDRGHGTHCAGIVASQDATFRGIAPGAAIIDIRIMDTTGSSSPAWATAGLTAAATSGADIASNSWGFSHRDGAWFCPSGNCVLCTAADNLVNLGVVVVAASGNEGVDFWGDYATKIRCPGNARNVVTVGATDDADVIADFSSHGTTPDGRPKPDVAAPGVAIASTRAAGTGNPAAVVAPGIINKSGTSMSTPHVAGVAALMLDKNDTVAPGTVKTLIVTTTPGPIPIVWYGRVDARAAVDATPSPP
ncbi:Subtilase family protein [Nocardia amikacinitolerans]|uniref:Subtilase family protein n=1 Tax=Nocardia amikacinitolerans TaxID=756689 RepID=A0A285KX93_9NOCA|nr:S8 family serine peptidase [Nocardia amikacinitolerans]MCP2276146.1 Subtilase family protein [Nocardia amikacinitolerans]MCP2294417.1 Subtilase family protein [Nocardia amikacinitolerans]SNY77292.1 Subtilase family protein [Nocardia amikacinitolerans]